MIYYYLTSLILTYKYYTLLNIKRKFFFRFTVFKKLYKVINSYMLKLVMLNNNISFGLTNDKLIIIYSPIVFFNFQIIEKDK